MSSSTPTVVDSPLNRIKRVCKDVDLLHAAAKKARLSPRPPEQRALAGNEYEHCLNDLEDCLFDLKKSKWNDFSAELLELITTKDGGVTDLCAACTNLCELSKETVSLMIAVDQDIQFEDLDDLLSVISGRLRALGWKSHAWKERKWEEFSKSLEL